MARQAGVFPFDAGDPCPASDSGTNPVTFKTPGFIHRLANFSKCNQKLKGRGQGWHGGCYQDAATLNKG
ncbi:MULTISPECIES: hypothetical protein [Bradyrhizobium]|uniref:hypothetical protein n=1 Tax=Bradyrhizobium TaxID=374 RepID=UPI001146829A|nr:MULTISPECIES: hypothetical protein [Bradyrhizobium]